MKLSERIEAAQTELVSFKDKLVENEKLLDSENPEEVSAAMEVIKEVSADIETATANLNVLKKAEAALVSKAVTPKTPAVIKTEKSVDKPEELLVKTAAATMEAYIRRVPVEQILESRYGDDDAVKAVAGVVVKAAQNPAMTNVAGWAQELTRESYGAFMDLLQPESVIPQLPLSRHEFNGFKNIKIPMRAETPALPNLAGAFRAEGDPIRVGAATVKAVTLTPKSLGVIGTFTNELFERSTPNIEQAIRNWMVEDTAVALDTAFLGSTAGSSTVPAGLQTYATAGNTAASGGNTAANITADLRGRLQAMTAAGMGRRPVWIMNPARAYGVSLALTAAGTPAFPEMQNGVLVGVPVVTSVTVPAGVVFLVDAAEISFAGGAPRFMGTDVATIHEEALQTDVAPIVDAGTGAAGATAATDVANPVRSLFQTNSAALRATWELDWACTRPAGSVQTITGAAW